MLFRIDEASDERITGWVRSCRPDSETTVLAILDGRERLALPTEALLPSATEENDGPPAGARRFVFDRLACPGLGSVRTVELYESDTHLLVFRRGERPGTPLRHVHLEPQHCPALDLAPLLSPHVAMSFTAADFMHEDTLVSVLGIDHCRSLLVCGNLAYRPYAAYFRAEAYTRSVLLGHPLLGLAGTLLRARMLGREGRRQNSWKHLGQPALNAAFRDVDLTDPRAIAVALDTLPDRCRVTLADALTRKLAANGPDDRLREEHAELALRSLAEFEVVGFEDRLDAFCLAIGSLAGIAELRPSSPSRPDEFAAGAAALAACEPAREFVRLDQLVYDLAQAAADEAA